MRRVLLVVLFLILSVGPAMAQSAPDVKLTDTKTKADVSAGIDNLGVGLLGGVNQRVFTITNEQQGLGPGLEIDSCSDTTRPGSPGFSWISPISPGTSSVTIDNGESISFSVSLVSSTPGVYTSTYECFGSAYFTLQVSWNLLYSTPRIAVSAGNTGLANHGSWTFPATAVGAHSTQTFTITNLGSPNLTVNSIAVAGAAFAVSPAGSMTIPGGGSANVTATFSPTAAGTASGSFTISSNDTTTGNFVLNLSGTGTSAPTASISVVDNSNGGAGVAPGTTVNYGTPAPGAQVTHNFQIVNSGGAALNISNPSSILTGTGYTLLTAPPATIAANGGTGNFSVGFNESSAGTFSGQVAILSNGTPSPYSFNLLASIGGTSFTVTDPTATVTNGGTINFGSVAVGQESDVAVFIHNQSTSPLSVTVLAPTPSNAGWSADFSTPITVPAASGGNPGVLRVAYLHFIPTAVGPAPTGRFTFVAGGVIFNLNLTGTGLQPEPRMLVNWSPSGAQIVNGGTYSFGVTTPGVIAAQVFQIADAGTAPLNVSNFTLTNTSPSSGFSLIVTPTSPIGINGGSSGRIRLLSSVTGSFAATLSFDTDDPNFPVFSFNVTGTVQTAAPTFSVVSGDGVTIVNGGTYSFGSIAAGSSVSRGFTLTNNGSTAMTINDPSSFLSTAGGFSIQQAFPSTAIAPGATGACRIKFTPSAPGSSSGTVTIDGGAAGIFTFTVTGTAT